MGTEPVAVEKQQGQGDVTATHHWLPSQEGRCPKGGKPVLQDICYLLMALQVGFNLRLIRSCDEKLVPGAQGPGNRQLNSAGGGPLVTFSVPTEHPDLAPRMAVKGEGYAPCHQRESPEWLRLRGSSGSHHVQPSLLKQTHLEHIAQDSMHGV